MSSPHVPLWLKSKEVRSQRKISLITRPHPSSLSHVPCAQVLRQFKAEIQFIIFGSLCFLVIVVSHFDSFVNPPAGRPRWALLRGVGEGPCFAKEILTKELDRRVFVGRATSLLDGLSVLLGFVSGNGCAGVRAAQRSSTLGWWSDAKLWHHDDAVAQVSSRKRVAVDDASGALQEIGFLCSARVLGSPSLFFSLILFALLFGGGSAGCSPRRRLLFLFYLRTTGHFTIEFCIGHILLCMAFEPLLPACPLLGSVCLVGLVFLPVWCVFFGSSLPPPLSPCLAVLSLASCISSCT